MSETALTPESAMENAPARLALLIARRSPPALALAAPGPGRLQLDAMLSAALRVPDHGRMRPWRFVLIEGPAKDALCDRLEAIADDRPDAFKAKASLKKLRNPPLAIAVVSHTVEGRIPEWEQILSAGALCQNLLLAVTAFGFGGNWVTGWYAYDATARAMLGLHAGERIAGFVLIGTPLEQAPERERPALDAVTTWLDVDCIESVGKTPVKP